MNSNLLNEPNTAQLPAGAGTNGLADIRPPVEIPSLWLWFWLAVAAVLLIVVCFVLWRLLKRKRQTIPPIIYVPAHVRARQRLQEALALIDQPKPFCFAVSDTLRVYLEERFELRAPERTTEEFLHELQDAAILSPSQKSSLAEFLTRCDLVKFAKYEPVRDELQSLFDSASRLIDETEPRPATVETVKA
jgi:hypothetical protein